MLGRRTDACVAEVVPKKHSTDHRGLEQAFMQRVLGGPKVYLARNRDAFRSQNAVWALFFGRRPLPSDAHTRPQSPAPASTDSSRGYAMVPKGPVGDACVPRCTLIKFAKFAKIAKKALFWPFLAEM